MASLILDILLYLYFVIVVMAAIIGTRFRPSLPYPLNWLWIYLWMDAAVEVIVFLLKIKHISAMDAYNWFGPIEFFFVSLLYLAFFKTRIEKLSIKILVAIYTLFCISHIVLLNKMNDYHLIFLVRSILITGITLYYFLRLFHSDEILEINKSPLFWISIGWYIFCTASVFSMGLGVHVRNINAEIGNSVYILNVLLNIYLFSMFIVGLICSRRNPGFY